jgi:hypothetical protein
MNETSWAVDSESLLVQRETEVRALTPGMNREQCAPLWRATRNRCTQARPRDREPAVQKKIRSAVLDQDVNRETEQESW